VLADLADSKMPPSFATLAFFVFASSAVLSAALPLIDVQPRVIPGGDLVRRETVVARMDNSCDPRSDIRCIVHGVTHDLHLR